MLKFLWLAVRPISKTEPIYGWWELVNILLPIAYFVVPEVTQWTNNFDFIWFAAIPALLFLVAGIKLQWRVTRYERGKPVLKLGGPFKRMDDVDTNILPMWHIIIENATQNTCAKNVCVRMTNPKPPIITASPIVLHRLHDNNRPFEQRHNIRYGESVTFDLFACGQVNPDMFYLYRADGNESSQTGHEWMLSEEDNSIISAASHQAEGWQFDVTAIADPPTSMASETFCLKVQGGSYILVRSN